MAKSAKKGTASASPNADINPSSLALAAASLALDDDDDDHRQPCPEFGPGWTLQSFPCKNKQKAGKNTTKKSKKSKNTRDTRIWYSPKGQTFHSAREVERFLAENQAGMMMKDDDEEDEENHDDEEDIDKQQKARFAKFRQEMRKKMRKNYSADPKSGSENEFADSVLNTPVKNIRVKVNVASKEIVGVKGDPVDDEEEEEEDDGSASGGGFGEAEVEGGKDDDKRANDDDDDVKGGSIVDENAHGVNASVEEEVEDVMMMDLPGSNDDDDATPAKEGAASPNKGEGVVLDYFGTAGGAAAAGDGDGNADGNGNDAKKDEEDEEPEEEPEDKEVAAARAAVAKFNYDSDDSVGDDDPGTKDDSSYSGSDGGKESEEEEGDDEDDDDDVSKMSGGSDDDTDDDNEEESTSPNNKKDKSLLHAKVRLTSGFMNGMLGTIVGIRRGWYTLDKSSGIKGAMRARDFTVLTYADGTKGGGDEDGNKVTSSKNATSSAAKNQKGVDANNTNLSKNATSSAKDPTGVDLNTMNLVGAVIRIRNGKFTGLKGLVNERQSYRHVQLDSHPPIPPVMISNVEVLSYDDDKNADAEDLTKRYMGARVRVKAGPDEEYAGVEGKVLKVIVGNWYITDNPKITNAYRADKFEVLKFPPGINVAADAAAVKCSTGGGGMEKKTSGNEEEEESVVAEIVEEEEREEEEEENAAAAGEAEENNAISNVSDAANNKVKEERNTNEEEEETHLEGAGVAAAARVVDDVFVPPAAAHAPAASTQDLPNTARHRSQSEETNTRDLIGAIIRIKKGRFKNLTGIIKEKQSIRRLQLNTVPTPLDFADVNVLQYAPNADEDSDDFAKKYQKYVGASVKVLQPEEYAGVEGKVIRVIVLGDWYITDNPDIAMAFPEHKFDVLRWPPGQEEDTEEGGSDDDDYDATIDRCRSGSADAMKGKSEEEEKHSDDDNLKREGEAEEEDVEMKEDSKEEERAEVDDADDWGNNGTEYRPESPVYDNENMMDVDREEEDAIVASDDVGTKEDEHNTNAPSSSSVDDDKKDSIGKEEDAKEEIMHASSNNEKQDDDAKNQKDVVGREDAKDEEVNESHDEKQDDAKEQKDVEGREDDAKEEEVSESHDAKEQDDAKDRIETSGKEDDANEEVNANDHEKQEGKPPERKLSHKRNEKPPADPFIGATAYIYWGNFQGLSGKIIMTEERGWWTIDNPLILKKVKCNQCKLVDDGNVDMDGIKEWYSGRKTRMPLIVKPGREEEEEEEEANVGKESGSGMPDIENKNDPSSFKRKIAETDFTGDGTSNKRRKELGVIEGGGGSKLLNWGLTKAVAVAAIIPNVSQVVNDDGRNKQRRPKMREDTAPALNPIVLHPSGNDHQFAGKKKEKDQQLLLKMQLLPAGLRQLPPETKIEIFNRRTGKIMRGDNAILLSDLPMALMDHAEYEPMIPPPVGNASITSRIGRSGPNIRINSNVIPQTRVRASRVEGRDVLVTGGEYRGLSGTIDSCIPGGWYLVSNLFKNDNLDVVISSRHLELIPEKVAFTNSLSSEGQGVNKYRIHLKAAKLRLESLMEERKRLESSPRGRNKALVQLKLDTDVNKVNKLITDLQMALDRNTRDNKPCGQCK